MKKPVDLMFCCLGNGITVCDRAHMNGGDYATVAHIDPCGAIRYYTRDLPGYAREIIEGHARRRAVDYRRWFLRLSRYSALDAMYDRMYPDQIVDAARNPLPPDNGGIYARLIDVICGNEKRIMPRME
jgi:hypothetical protein